MAPYFSLKPHTRPDESKSHANKFCQKIVSMSIGDLRQTFTVLQHHLLREAPAIGIMSKQGVWLTMHVIGRTDRNRIQVWSRTWSSQRG